MPHRGIALGGERLDDGVLDLRSRELVVQVDLRRGSAHRRLGVGQQRHQLGESIGILGP